MSIFLSKIARSVKGAARGKSRYRKLVRDADAARDRRDWAAAAAGYERYLDAVPGDAGIRVQAGHMYKENGDYAKAEAHYLKARAALVQDPDLNLQLGHFYKVAGRPYEAFVAYRHALSLDPANQEIRDEAQRAELQVRSLMGVPSGAFQSQSGSAALEELRALGGAMTAGVVRESGLFDAEWYLRRNTDIAALGLDPLDHFVEHGRFEGRLPGPDFEAAWYLETYPEVAQTGLDPFTHYIVAGRSQGLRPAGPPMYERWVKAFDTLGPLDFRQIDDHIAAVRPERPRLILFVNARSSGNLSEAIRGIRSQRLRPIGVDVCLAHDCTEATRLLLTALVGSDDRFRIKGAGTGGQADGAPYSAPLILVDAAVRLREHALYMMMMLRRAEGADFVYGDHDQIDEVGLRANPFFKPDASPELIRHMDYVGGCVLLPDTVDPDAIMATLSSGSDSVEGIVRRVFLQTDRARIGHVPQILFHTRNSHIAAIHPKDAARDGMSLPAADALPTVTIIVPTRDRVELLSVCIESLIANLDYPRDLLDIVVVDNGSTDRETLEYLQRGERDTRFRVLRAPVPFNYAVLNNIAARTSTSDILVLLNNDTETLDGRWLRGLVHYALQPDVGAVGPKLLYEDGTIQHAGVVMGIGVAAAHAHLGINMDSPGVYGLANVTHEVAAVTGACLAIRRTVFEELGGLDEGLAVAFNDVSLCLSALEHGYRNLYVHDVWMRHFESKSRGVDDSPAKVDIFIGEANYARRKHKALFANDPYYSPNLSLNLDDFYGPAFPPRCAYPWRDHARDTRKPRILLLAGFRNHDSELAYILSIQARYLEDSGYAVTIGRPVWMTALSGAVPQVVLDGVEAAACYAVRNDIDLVVCCTASYAGVSRLVGRWPSVLVHQQGFAIEERSGAATGRDAQVGLRLALPTIDGLIVTSADVRNEIGAADARVISPGGDRVGAWGLSSVSGRDALRANHGWSDKILILVDGTGVGRARSDTSEIAAIVVQFDLDHVTFLIDERDLAGPPPAAVSTFDGSTVNRGALLAAVDLLWVPFAGSALLAAEARAYGLTIVDRSGKGVSSNDAIRLSASIIAAGAFDPWRRVANIRSWRQALADLETAFSEDGRISTCTEDRGNAPVLLSSATLIRESGLFSSDVYLHYNTDIAAGGIDPWTHYSEHGGREGRQGSHLFHSKWYLAKYPEVARAGDDPLAHYLSQTTGVRDPNPYFSNRYYLEHYADVQESGLSPLVHYLRIGAAEGRSIGPGFDAEFYQRAHFDVGLSGMDAFTHFMTIGDAEGRLPIAPQLSPIALFDDAALARGMALPIQAILPPACPAEAIFDRLTAARYCINLMRRRADLRARFPHALRGGPEGPFAQWIEHEGETELGLSDRGRFFIRSVLADDYSDRVRQVYLVRTDLKRLLPFALIPEGAGSFLRWGLDVGTKTEGLTIDEIWWFLLVCAEDPVRELANSYLFNPAWQRNFPAGLTVFGSAAFVEWLGETFGIPSPATPLHQRGGIPAVQQVRIAYYASADWQAAHPEPFLSVAAATALLDWLGTSAAGLAAPVLTWLDQQDKPALAEELTAIGINMIGHFCYPSGLRTSTEALVEGVRQAGLRVTERDVWVQLPGDDNRHCMFQGLEAYDTTIILNQPEPFFDVAHSRAGLAPRSPRTYRIAYWYWELETIPDHWAAQAAQVDEIWTSTHFVGDALKAKFDLPIRIIPHGMELQKFEKRDRSYFGIPENQFLFLFTFHMMSIMERKNPLGLIEAFVREFKPSEAVGLVLKTSFGEAHPEQLDELRKAAAGHNITIIDSIYTKDEVLALMDACDSYISLHRSEGFGLTMAEAMLTGTPTIATGYSGNLDFMSSETSLLVDYELVTLDREYGPYKKGTRWAHASLSHAGACMRKVQSDPVWARELGLRGKADIEKRMSFLASGSMVSTRLREIASERARDRSPTPESSARRDNATKAGNGPDSL